MFNVGASELVLILLIAFVVVGPKDLPKVARALARAVRWVKNIIREVKKETGMDEVTAELKDMTKDVKSGVNSLKEDLTSPVTEVKKEIDDSSLDLKTEFKDVKKELDPKSIKSAINGGETK